MKDDLNFFQIEDDLIFCKWKTTSICQNRRQSKFVVEDNLNILVNDDNLKFIQMEDNLNILEKTTSKKIMQPKTIEIETMIVAPLWVN
jgi:uncharacterized protein YqfB (UPF0267 family)